MVKCLLEPISQSKISTNSWYFAGRLSPFYSKPLLNASFYFKHPKIRDNGCPPPSVLLTLHRCASFLPNWTPAHCDWSPAVCEWVGGWGQTLTGKCHSCVWLKLKLKGPLLSGGPLFSSRGVLLGGGHCGNRYKKLPISILEARCVTESFYISKKTKRLFKRLCFWVDVQMIHKDLLCGFNLLLGWNLFRFPLKKKRFR